MKKEIIYRIALLVGGSGFGIGFYLSLRSQPQLISDIQWLPATLVIIFGIPLTILANAFEFILIGSSFQRKISLLRAVEISVIASAANMLPLPGGTIARVAALRTYNIRYGEAIIANIIFALLWVAVAFVFAGMFLFLRSSGIISWFFLSIGIMVFIGIFLWISHRGISFIVVSWALLQRIFLVSLDALRLWWCLQALGLNAEYGQAATFVVGGVIGSAVSIVPAGLGVREGISAALAPLVGLAAASGFMASALNRLLALAVLSPCAFFLSLIRREKNAVTCPKGQ